MFVAAGPLAPCVTSKETFWASLRDLYPSIWMDVWWAKRSLPPSSGVMNPKPLESLNDLTVPLAIAIFLLLLLVDRANLRRGNPVGAGLHVELQLLRLPQGPRAASDDVGLIREDVRT